MIKWRLKTCVVEEKKKKKYCIIQSWNTGYCLSFVWIILIHFKRFILIVYLCRKTARVALMLTMPVTVRYRILCSKLPMWNIYLYILRRYETEKNLRFHLLWLIPYLRRVPMRAYRKKTLEKQNTRGFWMFGNEFNRLKYSCISYVCDHRSYSVIYFKNNSEIYIR